MFDIFRSSHAASIVNHSGYNLILRLEYSSFLLANR